MTNQCSSTE